MTSCSAAGLFFAVPVALGLSMSVAFAGEAATTVSKSAPTTGAIGGPAAAPEDELRPSIGESGKPAEDSVELTPAAMDEGAGWEAAVDASQAPTPLIGAEQDQAVAKINAYFNAITNLQGRFEQIDSANKRLTGRFYVQRPGKIRFDYAPPSGLRIVADGAFLAIEDSDLKTIEKYPIKSTPFRLLLSESVDLRRDARIVGVERQQGLLAISLEDKSGEGNGRIRLSFDTGDELRLKEWVISDAQGLNTRVTVNDVVSGRKVAADFFTSKAEFQPFQPFR
jgi:outer membrane lipoprotein-sorting protein